MTRSIWKGPFVDSHLLKKLKSSVDSNKNTVIKVKRSFIDILFLIQKYKKGSMNTTPINLAKKR